MKAVLFDIYETLITAEPVSAADRESNLAALRVKHDIDPLFPLTDAFRSEIRSAHARSAFPFPEVDVREIWSTVLPDHPDPEALAADYENAVHPTIPVSGARELILELHQQGILLGLVSNAQAYTHDLLWRHLGTAACCFMPDSSIFSYQVLRAKPDPYLFELAIAPLREQDLAPHDILMVGDSEKNDVEPARQLGLQTHQVTPGILIIPGL